jgi:hypothetical protein
VNASAPLAVPLAIATDEDQKGERATGDGRFPFA